MVGCFDYSHPSIASKHEREGFYAHRSPPSRVLTRQGLFDSPCLSITSPTRRKRLWHRLQPPSLTKRLPSRSIPSAPIPTCQEYPLYTKNTTRVAFFVAGITPNPHHTQPPHQPLNPTSPLLRTPKTRLRGRVFGVCRHSWLAPSPPLPFPSCSTWTCFWCPQALLHSTTRNMPPWVCFCFLLAIPHLADTENASARMRF